ncbi:MAG: peptidoglycan DD-metalloendopeptidase family protein [Gammaproteobacteria bacterium]
MATTTTPRFLSTDWMEASDLERLLPDTSRMFRLARMMVLAAALWIAGMPTMNARAADFDESMAWPLCGHDTLLAGTMSCPTERWGDPQHADPLTSASFGPRPLVSENYRYDFHRGLDIPAPLGTAIFAVTDGVVRKAGNYSSYTDPVIIVRHFRPGTTSCADVGCYHSLYLHVLDWVVSEDDPVTKGQLIGYTGQSQSGFAHLHFEIRNAPANDPYSSWQRDTIHPLRLLPYAETGVQTVTIASVDETVPENPLVNVTVTGPRYDLVRVELELLDANGVVINQPGNTADERGYNKFPSFFDMEKWNAQYTHKNSSAVPWESFGEGGINQCPYWAEHGASYSAHVHMDAQAPNNPEVGLFNGVRLETERYWDGDYFLGLTFLELQGPIACIRTTAHFAAGADPVQSEWGACPGGDELSDLAYAVSETTVHGTLSGDYTDTQQAAGSETVTEVESGGKPAKRTSRMEHTWRVDSVRGGDLVQLFVTASAPTSNDGDAFQFSTSIDNQQTWQSAFILEGGSSATFTAQVSGAIGTVYVKLTDTDRNRGNRTLDSVTVSELVIESAASGDITPEPPTALIAAAVSSNSIQLNWTAGVGQVHYQVSRWESPLEPGSYTDIGTTTATNAVDTVEPQTSYSYQVCGIDGNGNIIGCIASNAVTTPAEGPTLSAIGHKEKGRHKVNLSWTGSAAVDVFRDGVKIFGGVTGGITDNINLKGSATYTYQVCNAAELFTCSNTVTVVF